MVRCVAVGCKNETNTKGKGGKKLSFFKFPKDERREAWVKAMNRKNWTPTEYSHLCSEHFSSDQVISLVSGLRVREKAVPNRFSTHLAKLKTNSKLGGTSKQKDLKEEDKLPKTSAEPNEPSTTSEPYSPSCYVPNCTAKEALMFSVPKDADLRGHWESIIGRTDGRALTENDFVCEAHFMKSMIQVVYEKQDDDVFRGVKKLVDEAVPTVFPNTAAISGSAPETASENLSSTSSAPASKASEKSPSTSSQEPIKTTLKGKRPTKRKCCVPNCASLESPSNTLHHFPVQAGRCKTWLNLLNMSDFKPNKSTRVCSKHFASSSFSNRGDLRADAVPKLYSSSSRKLQQESDPDSLLSEAQKTAAWLQSVKRKREERMHKRVLGPGPLRKRVKVFNPWGVKDCDVVISKKERKRADAALPMWEEYERKRRRDVDVPLPIVEVKEEPADVMDLTADDFCQVPLPPSPVRPLKPILPKVSTPPKLNTSGMAVPPLITANNLVFQTTLRSASEVKSVQKQPLPPSTIYRVIIPTSVQGHTIEPSSILEQLKEKISAMHQEKINKSAWASGSPQIARISTPAVSTSTSTPASHPTPLKLPLSSTPKTVGKAAVLKSNNLVMKDSPPVGEHAYASKPNQSSWPILLQTPMETPVAASATLAASTSSTPLLASTSSASQFTTQSLTPVPDLGIPSFESVAPPVTYCPIKLGKTDSPQQPVTKKVRDAALSIATLAPTGTLKVVPNLTKTGPGVGSFMTFGSLSVATQTNLAHDNLIPQKHASEMKKTNEKYRSKIKVLKQSLRRTTNRLQKATKELEEYKCLKSLMTEQEKGRENFIVIEDTDKCACFARRREHEDVGDILSRAVKRRIPTPAESKATVVENEKLMKRIGLIKAKLKHREITRVVVFQTEELLPMF